MSLEENKALVRRVYEVGMNNHDWALIDAAFDDSYSVYYPGAAPIHGWQTARRALAGFLEAFPDMNFEVDQQLAEGDRVVTRWTGRGTHAGEYRGFPEEGLVVPPTHRPVTFGATDIYRIANGKIMEEWNTLETLVILQQIGVVSLPE